MTSKPLNYSKWDHIEISDDEDDQHPNIDTASLNRWRHQARLDRMQEAEMEKQEFQKQIELHKKQKEDIETKRKEGEDVNKLEEDWSKIDKEIKAKQAELVKKEKSTPLNVDTISKPGFTKTVVNAKPKAPKEELSEDERAEKFREFRKTNKKLMEQFGLMRKYEDSKRFLLDNPHLACEDTTNFLTVWCVDLAMDDKISLMEHVSHQCISMQFMLEFAKQVDRDPRSCIADFYSKIAHAEQTEYKRAFDDELTAFRQRVVKRSQERIAEALAEAEEEEKKERIKASPGGLDPMEVFDSLPEELRKCFDSQSVSLLQETIAKMPLEEATLHMKRCIASGLWVPEANKDKSGEDDANDDEIPDPEANVYEEIEKLSKSDSTKNSEDAKNENVD